MLPERSIHSHSNYQGPQDGSLVLHRTNFSKLWEDMEAQEHPLIEGM